MDRESNSRPTVKIGGAADQKTVDSLLMMADVDQVMHTNQLKSDLDNRQTYYLHDSRVSWRPYNWAKTRFSNKKSQIIWRLLFLGAVVSVIIEILTHSTPK